MLKLVAQAYLLPLLLRIIVLDVVPRPVRAQKGLLGRWYSLPTTARPLEDLSQRLLARLAHVVTTLADADAVRSVVPEYRPTHLYVLYRALTLHSLVLFITRMGCRRLQKI